MFEEALVDYSWKNEESSCLGQGMVEERVRKFIWERLQKGPECPVTLES